MKHRIQTPTYTYKHQPLYGYIDVKIYKRHAYISWNIGSLDNYAETSNPIGRANNHDQFHKLFQEYHIWANGWKWCLCGSRWGSIIVRKEQVGAFIRRFQPFWFALIDEALKEVCK